MNLRRALLTGATVLSPGHAHMPQDLKGLETDSDSASRGKKKRWAAWSQLKNSSLLPTHNVSCPPALETLPRLAQCCQQHKDITVIMIPPLITSCSLHWVPLLCHLMSSSHPPRVSQLVAKAVTPEVACSASFPPGVPHPPQREPIASL